MPPPNRPSPIALTVLCLLRAGPLHPYGMQRLIKAWGKDQVINVGHRANLYKTIKRLDDEGLVTVHQIERDQAYPERTVYELTDAGRQEGLRWLADFLGSVHKEYPDFPAALSFAMLLAPSELADVLERRAETLAGHLSDLETELHRFSAELPRITLIETEYQQTLVSAELQWLRQIIKQLRTETLTWTEEQIVSRASSWEDQE
ncbi:MAG: PadR family transcriptional regulator [Streptosporangiaceae bacterium]